MIKEIINLLGGLRLFIGLVFLMIGCFCDFHFYGIGTLIRFFFGLGGAYLMLDDVKFEAGYLLFLLLGLFIYTFSIRSGRLHLMGDYCYLDGWFKYAVRLFGAFLFIFGYRDMRKETR